MGTVGPIGDGGTNGWIVGGVSNCVHGVDVELAGGAGAGEGSVGDDGIGEGLGGRGVANMVAEGVASAEGRGVTGAVSLA